MKKKSKPSKSDGKDAARLPVAELKRRLSALGVDCSRAVERGELEELLRRSEEKLAAVPGDTRSLQPPSGAPDSDGSKKATAESAPTSQTPTQEKRAYGSYAPSGAAENHGSKEVPKGAPLCLSGCVMVVSGVLPSLQRDEFNELVQEYGGAVRSAVLCYAMLAPLPTIVKGTRKRI